MALNVDISYVTFASSNTSVDLVFTSSELGAFETVVTYTSPMGTTITTVGAEVTEVDITITPVDATSCDIVVTVPPGGMTIVGTLSDTNPISATTLIPQTFGPYSVTLPDSGPDREIVFTVSAFAAPPPVGVTVNPPTYAGIDPGTFFDAGGVPVQSNVFPDEVTIPVVPFCVHPDSLVHTSKGLFKISDLRTDQNLHLIDINGQYIKMVANAKFIKTNTYVEISPGAFGPNKPSQPLLITEGHPVMFGSHEIISKRLINNSTIKKVTLNTFTNVFSLCTKDRTFVLINNISVCTWKYEDLLAKKVAGKCVVEFL
jgi:hypothetical protein